MSASTESSSKIKTARIDVCIKATTKTAQASAGMQLTPHKFLNETVADFIKESTPEDITENVGVFYAQSFELGGLFRKTYVMEMQESDTSSSITAELKASYGPGLVGKVSGSAKMEYGTRSSNKNAKMKTTWHCEGGDTTVWLGCSGPGNIDSTQSDWAQSMNDTNLFCYNMKVKPIWELCAKVDKAKGEEVKEYCLAKWKVDADDFRPTDYVKAAQEKIVAMSVERRQMAQAGSDAGSGAKQDLRYWAYNSGDWLMLGHSCEGNTMTVVKPGPWVKKATGWKRIWKDAKSRNSKDYDIFVPTCGDEDFLALGCVCAFGTKDHAEPLANSPFACVHKSMCEPVHLQRALWNDGGTGAKWDVTLNEVPGIGTMWPSKATFGHPGQAHRIKSSCM